MMVGTETGRAQRAAEAMWDVATSDDPHVAYFRSPEYAAAETELLAALAAEYGITGALAAEVRELLAEYGPDDSLTGTSGRGIASYVESARAEQISRAAERMADATYVAIPQIGQIHCGYAIFAAVPDGRDEYIVAAHAPDRFAAPYAVWRVGRPDGALVFSAGDYDQRSEVDAIMAMMRRAGYKIGD